MNYACIDKNTLKVVNNIEWDQISPLDPFIVENFDLISWDENTKGYPINVNDTYDPNFEGFIHPKPEQNPSFIFDYDLWDWKPPIPCPDDGLRYEWDEKNITWNIDPDIDIIDLDQILRELEDSSP
jgi:hypothetical protein